MTIIVFLIDTSASMSSRCYLGTRLSFLDLAKEAVETFIKVRQKSLESRGDRYMLLTFEDPPLNIKAGWKENLGSFIYELRNLKSYTLTTMAKALKNTFDLLNVNRMQSGIDTYGQGRCPFYLEPSVIILVTDGGKLNLVPEVQIAAHTQYSKGSLVDVGLGMVPTVHKYEEGIRYPKSCPIIGHGLTTEPYRWDQRLYSLVLRLPGTPAMEHHFGLVPPDTSPIDNVCEATGGRSYCVTSYGILMQCVDSLVQKVQSGVVISLEKIGLEEGHEEVRPTAPGWHKCRRQIYVDRSGQKGVPLGYWPIPESYWPDSNSLTLPPRAAHPIIMFSCRNQVPMLLEGLPVDKYELEPSPLTQYILARKQPMVCWQVFVANSSKQSKAGYPFGYLKANLNLTQVCLYVLPYNYPVLLPLLEELFKCMKSDKSKASNLGLLTPAAQVHEVYKPCLKWRTKFVNYLRTIPPYYVSPLKRVLRQKGMPEKLVQALIPDSMDIYLSITVLNFLKNIKKEAKSEFDRICNTVQYKTHNDKVDPNVIQVTELNSQLKKETVTHPIMKNVFRNGCEQLYEFSGFIVGFQGSVQKHHGFETSRYVPRDQLFSQYLALRDKVLNPTHHPWNVDERKHNLPVSQMGNYHEYLKGSQVALREMESTSLRNHMFGNPFKIDKNMKVDEADVDPATGTSPIQGSKHSPPRDSSSHGRAKKRKYSHISNVAPLMQE